LISVCLALVCTAALVAGIALTSAGAVPEGGSPGLPDRTATGSIFDDASYRERAEPIHDAPLSVEDYLDGEWQMVEIAKDGSERIVVRSLAGIPGYVTFGNAVASFSECPQYDFAFRVDEEGRLLKLRDENLPNASSGCPALPGISYPLETTPVEWDALRVLHGDPELSIIGLNTLLLSREPFILVLERTSEPPSQPF